MPRTAKPSAEEAAFLQAILDDPDNDIPRLVFADWLEERGNPRGSFIRLQCSRAKLGRTDPAWKELLAEEAYLFRQHEAEWTAPLQRHVAKWEYRRGFVHEVTISIRQFLKSAPILYRHAPIRSAIFVNEPGADLGTLASCPHLAKLSAVRLPSSDRPSGISADSLRRFAQSPFVVNLTDLDLSQGSFGPGGVVAFAQSPHLSGLRRLGLRTCGIGAGGVSALAASPHLTGLRILALVRDSLDEEATAALAAANFRLHYLELTGNKLNSRALSHLVNSPVLSELRGLVLHDNHITNLGIEALVRSPHLQHLEHLDLSRNRVNDSGIPTLIELAKLPMLKALSLYENEFGPFGVKRLEEAPECAHIRALRSGGPGNRGTPFTF